MIFYYSGCRMSRNSEGTSDLRRKNQKSFFHCFSSLEFPYRCNVMTPDATHRHYCKSANYKPYIRGQNHFLSHQLKVSTHEKKILFCSYGAACNDRGFRPG